MISSPRKPVAKNPIRSVISVASPIADPEAPYFLPYQEKWISDESSFKLYEKSRRIGITYATSYRCFQKCMKRTNFTQWVSSRDLLTAKEFISDYVARWVKLAKVAAIGLNGENIQTFDLAKDVKAFVVDFPMTGSRIVSLSSTPEVFAGKGGDVLLDEVDLHDDPGRLIDMAMPCTTWGGQVEAISAYRVDGSPASVFAVLCSDAKAANPMHASFHRTTILDAVDQGFVECVNHARKTTWTRKEFVANLRARCRTENAWQSQYLCNPQDDGGSLLTYGLISGCEVDAMTLQRNRDPNAPAYLGIDIGRKHDLTVFWMLRRLGDVLWTDSIHIFEKTFFHIQLSAAINLIESQKIVRVCVDCTGIGAMLAEELQRKFKAHRVEQVWFTPAVKMDIGLPLMTTFQDKGIRIPGDSIIREDLHKTRKITTSSGNIRLEADSDDAGHADRFWALALATHAADAQPAQVLPKSNRQSKRARVLARRRDRSAL